MASQRARIAFCWLPPDRSLIGFSRPSVRISNARIYLSARSFCSEREIGLAQPCRACKARTLFSRTERSPMMPSVLRSPGRNRNPRQSPLRRGECDLSAVDLDRTGIGGDRPNMTSAVSCARTRAIPPARPLLPRQYRDRRSDVTASSNALEAKPRRSGLGSRAYRMASLLASSRPSIIATRSRRSSEAVSRMPTSLPFRRTVMRSEIR